MQKTFEEFRKPPENSEKIQELLEISKKVRKFPRSWGIFWKVHGTSKKFRSKFLSEKFGKLPRCSENVRKIDVTYTYFRKKKNRKYREFSNSSANIREHSKVSECSGNSKKNKKIQKLQEMFKQFRVLPKKLSLSSENFQNSSGTTEMTKNRMFSWRKRNFLLFMEMPW